MPDPVILAVMVLLAALLELAPRRLVPLGAVLAEGVVLGSTKDHQDGIAVIALAGAAGIALASIGTALAARRGRDQRGQPSAFATAQREALRARLSSSRAFTRLSFVMAAIPGPTAKLLYPLLGAMRAPLLPAIVGTIVGRTVLLSITTSIFTWLARVLSNSDTGAAEFLISVIVILVVTRTLKWIDWEHRAATGSWRFRESRTEAFSGRMFGGNVPDGRGFPSGVSGFPHDPRAREADTESPGDEHEILEGDVLGEEILDGDDDGHASGSNGGDDASPSAGELPSGS